MEITNTTLKMLLRDFNNGEMSVADARNILNEIAPSLENDELEFVEEIVLKKEEEEFEEDTIWLDQLDQASEYNDYSLYDEVQVAESFREFLDHETL
jgi:hypothetical protein